MKYFEGVLRFSCICSAPRFLKSAQLSLPPQNGAVDQQLGASRDTPPVVAILENVRSMSYKAPLRAVVNIGSYPLGT
jgi:hypothetical protein